jgi:hypothetical protein
MGMAAAEGNGDRNRCERPPAMPPRLAPPRLLPSLLPSLLPCLLSVAALAGCSSEPGRARFADATPAQLARAYTAATGLDLASALIMSLSFAEQGARMGCPAVSSSGGAITVTGGCTAADGARFDGAIAIRGLHAPDGDEPAPISVELDFQIAPPARQRIALDGRVELDLTSDAPAVSGDLTIDDEGIASTSRLALACSADHACTASPGSELEISGLGGASVEGNWSLGDPPTGLATVRGDDALVLDMARRSLHCAPYQLGRKSGTVCPGRLIQEILAGG